MSVTLQQNESELKILWSLEHQAAEDVAGFLKIANLKRESSLEQCSFYFLGEKEISTFLWRALLESLKVILDRKIKMRFIVNSKTMEAILRKLGFSLLGEVLLEVESPLK